MTEKNEIVLMNFTGVYKEQEFYREEKNFLGGCAGAFRVQLLL